MIAALLMLASPPMPGPIGPQQLPARGCAAFLWSASASERATGPVAMASAEPPTLRLALDGAAPIDLARTAQHGETQMGMAASADYRGGDVAAALDLAVAPRADLRDGAAVPQATLRVRRDGGDELVMPLAGLIGCRSGT